MVTPTSNSKASPYWLGGPPAHPVLNQRNARPRAPMFVSEQLRKHRGNDTAIERQSS